MDEGPRRAAARAGDGGRPRDARPRSRSRRRSPTARKLVTPAPAEVAGDGPGGGRRRRTASIELERPGASGARCGSRTPATARSRSARTSTSPTSTPALVVRPRRPRRGFRLDVPAGTSVRFEPGVDVEVTLVRARRHAGARARPAASRHAVQRSSTGARYAELYGPTIGDRVRLADTDLWIEVDRRPHRRRRGDEAVFGGGKVIRESMLPGRRHARRRRSTS